LGLVALCVALGVATWSALVSRATDRPGTRSRPERTGPDSVAFFSVTGEGVDLEVVAPDGARAITNGASPDVTRIPGAETNVDCPGFSAPGGREAECTASVNVATPRPGDYVVIARGPAARTVMLTVGWATANGVRRGSFSVNATVGPTRASRFDVIVSREDVSQRSEPRSVAP